VIVGQCVAKTLHDRAFGAIRNLFSFDKDFFFYFSSDVVNKCRVG